MIKTFDKFCEHFRDLANRDADLIKPTDRQAYLKNWFESEWSKYLLWYKEQYPKKYVESLTLEQIARL